MPEYGLFPDWVVGGSNPESGHCEKWRAANPGAPLSGIHQIDGGRAVETQIWE